MNLDWLKHGDKVCPVCVVWLTIMAVTLVAVIISIVEAATK